MSELPGISEQLKDVFTGQLRQQEELLRVASDRFAESREVIERWPSREKRLGRGLLDRFDRWRGQLKHINRPFNLVRYKREKKRMIRSRKAALASGPGLQLFFLRSLNILRILIISSIYLGVSGFIVYLVLKGIKVI